MIIEPGIYREDLIVDQPGNHPLKVSGYGVVIEGSGIQVRRSGVILEGFIIRNSKIGLSMLRGQGSRVSDVRIESCETGLFFGDENTQVAWSSFQNIAVLNSQYGIRWEYSSPEKSWCNANKFDTLALRGCENPMFADNRQDRINYNTFINMQIEGGNSISVHMPYARQNTFIGGHFVQKDASGKAATLGPFNHLFGGRYVGTVDSPHSQILVGSGVQFESGRYTQLKLD